MEDYEEVRQRINQEGLDYFLMHYTSADSMPTEKGRKLFEKALKSLRKFEAYVEKEAEKIRYGE